jgi:hypothetical protein
MTAAGRDLAVMWAGFFFFLSDVRGAASNSAYYGYPSCGSKVSCSQIPRRGFAGIRTHDPLVESPTSKPFGHDAPLGAPFSGIELVLSKFLFW